MIAIKKDSSFQQSKKFCLKNNLIYGAGGGNGGLSLDNRAYSQGRLAFSGSMSASGLKSRKQGLSASRKSVKGVRRFVRKGDKRALRGDSGGRKRGLGRKEGFFIRKKRAPSWESGKIRKGRSKPHFSGIRKC